MGRTQSKKKADHRAKRAERRYCMAKAEREGWSFINTKKKTYTLVQDTYVCSGHSSVLSCQHISISNIFQDHVFLLSQDYFSLYRSKNVDAAARKVFLTYTVYVI